VFSRIASATTSMHARSILQKEFQGDSKGIVVRLQSLRLNFETLVMKTEESVADFLSRATTIVSQMRPYREKIVDRPIVEKSEKSKYKGRGRGGFRSRCLGNGRGRGCFDWQRQSNKQRNNMSNVQCHHFQKNGHIQADCWYKDKQINFAAENGE
ncbi:hypothetical protein MIMGU_mgv1a025221mg, partial [Erythranthe guttata]